MKKTVVALAGILTLNYVSNLNAAQIKVNDNTWADFGLNMKVWYQNFDKREKDSWKQHKFNVNDVRLYFEGQVNKLFQFYGEFDYDKDSVLSEAGINLAFTKEFQILAGKIRKPFTRSNLVNDYTLLLPRGHYYDPHGFLNILNYPDKVGGGVVFHGDLANGMFNYRVGAFNSDLQEKTNKDFQWYARVEFTPTMLGFKPEPAATITGRTADTYLGSKDIFTIGLGYMNAKRDKDIEVLHSGDDTVKGWTADVTFEKKYGTVVPNLQLGYVKLKDTHRDPLYDKLQSSKAWYIQGQLLYDQVVGIGKPAIAIRYDKTTYDKAIDVNNELKDGKIDRLGVAFNYYIKNQAAKVSVGFDNVKYKDGLKKYLESNNYKTKITDYYVNLQIQF